MIHKGQPIDIIIPTVNGDKLLADLIVGDELFDMNGNPTKIIKSLNNKNQNCYEITFSDGRKTQCSENYIWCYLTEKGNLNTKSIKIIKEDYKKEKIIFDHKGYKYKYRIPKCKPIKYNEKELIIPPYSLGVLIGDGCLTCHGIQVSSNEPEILDKVSNELNLKYHKSKGDNYTYCFELNGNKTYTNELKKLNLKCNAINKYIPIKYLEGSVEQRKQLLMGLMDTDGCIEKTTKSAKYTYFTSSVKLKNDIIKLCRSLGYHTSIYEDDRMDYIYKNINYKIAIFTNDIIVSSKKHLNRIFKFGGLNPTLLNHLKIKNIEYIGNKDTMSLIVDNDKHLYVSNDYIVTHDSFEQNINS